jgi:hypothetical protein
LRLVLEQMKFSLRDNSTTTLFHIILFIYPILALRWDSVLRYVRMEPSVLILLQTICEKTS